jgi:hypothetical protein
MFCAIRDIAYEFYFAVPAPTLGMFVFAALGN